MLRYNDKPISNSRSIGPDSFYVSNFLQMYLNVEPTTCRNRILRIFPDKPNKRLVLDGNSAPAKLGDLAKSLGFDELRNVTANHLNGQEEAISSELNRFCKSAATVLLLYLRPDPRVYCTRTQNFVVKPGDLIVIGPQTDVCYTKALLLQDDVITDKKGVTLVFQ